MTPAKVLPAEPPHARVCPVGPRTPLSRVARISIGNEVVQLEVARTEAERERGLMFRTELDKSDGMVFVMDSVVSLAFWMRNTCIPLDMLFVADDGFIVGSIENVPVLNEVPREVACRSRFVIELPAGFASRHEIKPGMFLVSTQLDALR